MLSLCLLSLSVAARAAEPAADFYVAPDGNDTWSGKLAAPNAGGTDGPFATPGRAQEALRAARKAEQKPRPWRVMLRGGTYALDAPLAFAPEDSGTRGAPNTWAAYPGEKPVLSGGRTLSGWRKGDGPVWTTTVPGVAEGKWYFHQLFINGSRRTRARTPNEGFLRTAGNLPEITDLQKQRNEPAAKLGFTFKGTDLKAWPDLGDANVVLYYDWSTSRHWVTEVDEARRTIRFTNPTGWPVCHWEKEQRYHVEGFREALDQPGEWHLDRKTGTLSYWPLPGEEMTKVQAVAPRFERLLELSGDPAAGRFVEHIRFEGLSFHYADWQHDKNKQAEMQAAVFCTGALYGAGARDCHFTRCEIAHVGEYALWLEEGCQSNEIRRCEIRDMGAGGIRLGSERYTDQADRVSQYNVVDNCFIHDGGHVFPDGVGVWIGHSSGNQITHNEICDLIYSGVSAGWSWGHGRSGCHHNIIEWNHIHHLGMGVLSELSAIYTLGVMPGTRICNNLLHDTYDYKFGSWGIGLDEGTSGTTVANNILYNNGYGIGLHYGHENLVRNNIVAFIRGHDLLGGGRKDGPTTMDVRNNLFYGNAGLITSKPWPDSNIVSDHNLFWDTTLGPETHLAGWLLEEWQEETGLDRHSLVADPLFVDPARFDFRLKPGSPALKVGFRPFDLSAAGLYGDPEWVDAPRKIARKPIRVDVKPAPGPLLRFTDGFEETAVGELPRLAQPNGEGQGASIRVCADAAATGKRSLKLTDAAGLAATWQPHLIYNPRINRGFVELSFDARLEKGAILVAAWRDWRSAMLTGPHVTLKAGGKVTAAGKDLLDVPEGKWIRVAMLAEVGAKGPRKWRLTLTPRGGKPVQVDGLPMESPEFQVLTWIGFISDANGPAVTYLDNVRLRSGRTEAQMK